MNPAMGIPNLDPLFQRLTKSSMDPRGRGVRLHDEMISSSGRAGRSLSPAAVGPPAARARDFAWRRDLGLRTGCRLLERPAAEHARVGRCRLWHSVW